MLHDYACSTKLRLLLHSQHFLQQPFWWCRRSIEEDEPWAQQGRPYEQWLCQVGDVLLDHCKDALLVALQKVARKRPAMMELVMPQLFASLALEGTHDDADLAQVLGAQVCLVAWSHVAA